jgi:hypothetical protein
MIAPNHEKRSPAGSATQERALQLQLQSLLLSLRTLYFAAEKLAGDHFARTERQLLRDLECVGERLKETNPDNWSP